MTNVDALLLQRFLRYFVRQIIEESSITLLQSSEIFWKRRGGRSRVERAIEVFMRSKGCRWLGRHLWTSTESEGGGRSGKGDARCRVAWLERTVTVWRFRYELNRLRHEGRAKVDEGRCWRIVGSTVLSVGLEESVRPWRGRRVRSVQSLTDKGRRSVERWNVWSEATVGNDGRGSGSASGTSSIRKLRSQDQVLPLQLLLSLFTAHDLTASQFELLQRFLSSPLPGRSTSEQVIETFDVQIRFSSKMLSSSNDSLMSNLERR